MQGVHSHESTYLRGCQYRLLFILTKHSKMAEWREEKEDAARHRQEKREATRLGKLLSHTEA